MVTGAQRKPGRPANEEIRSRRREQILDAAGKLFAKHGYSEAATQALADVLQVGKGTIYRYFATKEELFLAAVDRAMHRLTENVDRSIAEVEDPFSRMARGIEAYLEFFAREPELVELLIQERAQFKDRKKPTYFEYRDANKGRWEEEFRGLIAQGRVRDVPVERMLEVLGDLLYGTMFANYFAGRRHSPQEQAQDILDITLKGILSDAERERNGRFVPSPRGRGQGEGRAARN
jgi:AcrR family transcriptional regulator